MFFEGDVRNILPEHVCSAFIVSMLSQAFDCMCVLILCVVAAVYVVKDGNVLLGRETAVLANNK